MAREFNKLFTYADLRASVNDLTFSEIYGFTENSNLCLNKAQTLARVDVIPENLPDDKMPTWDDLVPSGGYSTWFGSDWELSFGFPVCGTEWNSEDFNYEYYSRAESMTEGTRLFFDTACTTPVSGGYIRKSGGTYYMLDEDGYIVSIGWCQKIDNLVYGALPYAGNLSSSTEIGFYAQFDPNSNISIYYQVKGVNTNTTLYFTIVMVGGDHETDFIDLSTFSPTENVTVNIISITPSVDNTYNYIFNNGTIQVGSLLGGGVVAYVFQAYDSGYDPYVQHGIITTVADIGYMQWQEGGRGNGYVPTIGYTSKDIGSGLSNTNHVMSILGTGQPHANRSCYEYSSGGYTDWFLPSQYELQKIMDNRAIIGGINTSSSYYWSSTEWMGYFFQLPAHGFTDFPKNASFAIRPTRYF